MVGGGPAGMTAAARASETGRRVLLLEKNAVLGKKLLISGGGRCNVTNATSDRHVLVGRYGKDGKHLHSLFARFGPEDTRTLLRRFGLETKVEAEGRVFPVTDRAASVRNVLEEYMRTTGVTIRRGCTVTGLVHDRAGSTETPRIVAIQTAGGEEITARDFVLATGGTARPETGSTGDAFSWLEALGIPVRLSESSLVPIRVPDQWVRGLQGLALEDAELAVQRAYTPPSGPDRESWANVPRVLSRRGKLLFTHFGLSGPLALNAASEIRDLAEHTSTEQRRIRLLVNPLPGTDPTDLERSITTAASAEGRRTIGKQLRTLLPPRLAETVCGLAGVPPAERLATLSRASRRILVTTLTAMPCGYGGLMGQEKAIVSSGGVDPAAVDFRTMRLRQIPNLFVLGDLLDFNRQSGGYSLQVCWAGGWVAGEALAET